MDKADGVLGKGGPTHPSLRPARNPLRHQDIRVLEAAGIRKHTGNDVTELPVEGCEVIRDDFAASNVREDNRLESDSRKRCAAASLVAETKI